MDEQLQQAIAALKAADKAGKTEDATKPVSYTHLTLPTNREV